MNSRNLALRARPERWEIRRKQNPGVQLPPDINGGNFEQNRKIPRLTARKLLTTCKPRRALLHEMGDAFLEIF
jgi:hypothetical protein